MNPVIQQQIPNEIISHLVHVNYITYTTSEEEKDKFEKEQI